MGVERSAPARQVCCTIKRPTAIAILALVLLVCFVFRGVLGMGFVRWDDDVNIFANPHFAEEPLANVGIFWKEWKEGYENLWIPLTYTVWAVLAEAAALPAGYFDDTSGEIVKARFRPAVFHGANLVLHAAAVLLVFGILRRLAAGSAPPGSAAAVWPAALGAAVFAVHPLHAEAVAWVTGMKDLLAGTLSFAALWAYLRYTAKAPAEGAGAGAGVSVRALVLQGGATLAVLGLLLWGLVQGWVSIGIFGGLVLAWLVAETARRAGVSGWYAVSTAAYVMALLAKPSAVVVPAIAFVLGAIMNRRAWRRTAFELYPWLWLAIVLTVFTYFAQSGGAFRYAPPPVWFRPVVALDALAFYLVKVVAPIGLAPDYGRSPDWLSGHWIRWISWMLPVAAGAAACYAWWARDRRLPFVALAVFGLALLPMLGLVPTAFLGVSAVADRYTYVALAGAALVVSRLLERHWERRWARAAALALVLALGGLTMRQLPYWKDTETLFARTLAVNPQSWLIMFNQGAFANERKDYDEALRLFQKVVELKDWVADAWCNIGTEYQRRGETERAYAAWRKAIAVQEGHFQALSNLSRNLIRDGRFEEAIAEVERSYKALPYANTREIAAQAHREQASILFNEKKYAESIPYFRKALKMAPKRAWETELAHAYNNTGVVLLSEKKLDDAIASFMAAIGLDPENLDAKSNLAYTLVNNGRSADAVRVFESYYEHFRLDPMWIMSLGVAYSDVGRPEDAKKAFGRAEQLLEAAPAPDEELRGKLREFRAAAEAKEKAAGAGAGVPLRE